MSDGEEPRKRCHGECGEEKPLTEFTPDRRKPDGHTSVCRGCLAKRKRDKRTAERDAGIPPPLGKKARARRRTVVSLDERRPQGSGRSRSNGQDGRPVVADHWLAEPPGPEPDTSWYEAFLERLATHRTVTDAAGHVGIHPVYAWRAIKRDPRFAEAYEYARQSAADRVESVSWGRAVDGWHEPLVDRDGNVLTDANGKVVTRHVYDSAMLRLILQGVAPEYRRGPAVAVQVNTQVNVSGVREKLVTKIDEYAARSG